MADQLKHLIFYDGNCGLCDHMVQFVFQKDIQQQFAFAPLQGKTASLYLKSLPAEMRFIDSLILIENYRSSYPRVYMLSQGALRIAWLLGWPWILIGWLFIFPAWTFDWIYRLVARNRHRLFKQTQCFIPPTHQKERFLP